MAITLRGTVLICTFLVAGFYLGSSIQDDECNSRRRCGDCIRTPNCVWCAQDAPFVSVDGNEQKPRPRCYHNSSAAEFECNRLIRPEMDESNPAVVLLRNDEFNLNQTNRPEPTVQLKPQKVRIKLRAGDVYKVQLPIFYAQASNYPIDLYYLMDLSNSMKDDKDNLSKLGSKLAEALRNNTPNFRMGFGSFVDKLTMPYVSTVPAKLEQPCTGCAAPYGFKHHLSLNSDEKRFTAEVERAKTSGNLDDPEGGFDALMQSIVCNDTIGWRTEARRLLVFSTDASFHFAGDGKLGGVVKPNDGECHLLNNVYTHSTILDYPSIAQINKKVIDNAINVIFAVTRDQTRIYQQLSQHIQGSSSGELDSDSNNVVQLVDEQYRKISSSVELKDNAPNIVSVQYYSSCLGDKPQSTNKCTGLKPNDIVNFTAYVTLNRCPESPSKWNQTFRIYPVGISEYLTVELEMLCDCNCKQAPSENVMNCTENGMLECGTCVCNEGHTGHYCECGTDNFDSLEDQTARCRPNNLTLDVCSKRGSCKCGMCFCDQAANQDKIYGEYCQCDNFSCRKTNSEVCSGPDRGTCNCGTCDCRSGWNGTSCECPETNAACIPSPGEQPCMGRGSCVCVPEKHTMECECNRGQQQYGGRFCETCIGCPAQCVELADCVRCLNYRAENPEAEDRCTNCGIEFRQDSEVTGNETHFPCRLLDENCSLKYVYEIDKWSKNITVTAERTWRCAEGINAVTTSVSVVAAVIVIGVLLLLVWKILTMLHDKREYAKFEKERLAAQWNAGENPLYQQATSTFSNPTYNRNSLRKST